MGIAFDIGSKERPKGHALLYFRSSDDTEGVWVTYLVVLPVSVDVSKYVPPFLMNEVGELAGKELSSFAFPPAPERMEGYDSLQALAANRDDDVLFGGVINPTDVPSAMMSINEAVQEYAGIYAQVASGSTEGATEEPEGGGGGVGVSEVLYGLMGDTDKLGELTRLAGRLRFSVEGADAGLVKEAEDDIKLLSAHLPPTLNIPQLVQAVKSSDSRAAELADLYLQRCYHLVQEEYGKLTQIEGQIKNLESQVALD